MSTPRAHSGRPLTAPEPASPAAEAGPPPRPARPVSHRSRAPASPRRWGEDPGLHARRWWPRRRRFRRPGVPGPAHFPGLGGSLSLPPRGSHLFPRQSGCPGRRTSPREPQPPRGCFKNVHVWRLVSMSRSLVMTRARGSRVEPSRLTALKTLRSPAPPPPPTGPSPRCLPVRAHACGLWRRLLSERARSAAPSWFGRPVRGPLTLLGCAVRREAPTRSPRGGAPGWGGLRGGQL